MAEASNFAQMSEQQKCAAGMWYLADADPEAVRLMSETEELCQQYNRTSRMQPEEQKRILAQLFPHRGEGVTILAPVFADYGSRCFIGEGTFINHGAYLMDGAPITIGKNCFIGPNFGAYTAQHPLLPEERNRCLEKASPITIGDNCWLGGDVKVMPGVTIGEGTVIGAGSVVTKDIPAGVIALGAPCKVVRSITEADSIQGELE